MNSTEIDKLRNISRQSEITDFIYATTSLLAFPLYLLFWIADLIYIPEKKWEFLCIRAMIIPVCFLTNKIIKRATSPGDCQRIVTFFLFGNSIILTVMIFIAEGAGSPYYAGYNLVAFVLMYMPLTPRYIIANIFILYGPFFSISALTIKNVSQLRSFCLNSFFIFAALVIAIVIRVFLERLRHRELIAQMELKNELESREKVIASKTEENIRLAHLSKQFSPQIVQTVQSGKINLESSFNGEVCVIFVDVVNSTDRINAIPLDRFNRVIGMFSEDATNVFLKYDITIDKFLGDGLLGFSNAPVVRKDFIARTLFAAIELRERFKKKQNRYQELWGSRFQTRIGVACGIAHIGFIGNFRAFKTYTAIGKSVNLASRLCSAATPDSIYISEEVVMRTNKDEFEISPGPRVLLKGFQQEDIKIYELIAKNELTKSVTDDISECPQGHGILHLDVDEKGLYVFTCRVCGYVATEGNRGGIKKVM